MRNESDQKMKMSHDAMDNMDHEAQMAHMNHAEHMGHMDHMDHMDHEASMAHDMNHHDGMDHDHGMMHMGNLKRKFWISLILSLPVIVLSPMMGINLPFQFTFPGSDWVVLVFASVLFFYGGQPFLAGARMELKARRPAMMTLIAMGITVSYVYSLYSFVLQLLNPHTHVMNFFWELATLIVIMLLGHWIEMNAISSASDSLKAMAELLPDQVTRKTAQGEESVSLQAVHVGDQLIVKAGDKMPTDGVIEVGSTTVNESMVTGEAKAVVKKTGDKVIGGSVNGSGVIEIKVTGTGEDSYLAKVMELVKHAQSDKSKLESISDKVARGLFYIALVAGVLAFVIWLLVTRDLNEAFQRMVTVFVIACPHALGLAIPLVIARSTSLAAKNGLLLKNRHALERATDIHTIMLDKTGTLTVGKFTVTGVELYNDHLTEKEALQYLGALEKNSNHPLAEGINNYLAQQSITPYDSTDVKNISGVGVMGTVNGKKIQIVSGKYLDAQKLEYQVDALKAYQAQGNTISFLLIDATLVAAIALGDTIKPEAKQFIRDLQERNITPVMLTGDNKAAAQAVANYLGITDYHAELLPGDKEQLVQKTLDAGKAVMMVGDGINDAPSLARATVGAAIGAGTDIAMDSADVILTNSNPMDIIHFLDLAKATRRKMISNLWWGAGYNIVAIPLAAGILAPWSFVLSPAVGAILMSLSTVVVAINALTLRMNRKAE